SNLQTLLVKDNKLDELPESIGNLLSLKVFRLDNNQVKKIPESIGNLKNLNAINFTGNPLESLPNSICNLDKVFGLDLSKNNITSLPQSFALMKGLERLNIQDCKITNLPENFGELRKLVYLDIRGTPLESLPDSIGQLINIWHLRVTNGKLKKLPASIGKLEKLKELNLEGNEIESLPIEMGDLKSLEKLTLDKNKLTNLPSELCNLSTLKTLDISDNFLVSLPDYFDRMTSLSGLSANRNNLTSIPSSLGSCESLRSISFTENQIETLPDSIGSSNIRTISLKSNKFKTLPYMLWPLETLENFDIEDNPLSEEEKQIIKRDMDTLRDYLKQRASMAIFISHAVVDYEPYKLAALGEYLENKPEVYDVLLCEQDLSGNIDDFMDQNVPISDVVFFLGTNKSVFNSVDCVHELELSRKYCVPVLPMKGTDVSWQDITTTGLSQHPGIEYNPQEFERLCEQIYEYVKKLYVEQRIFKIKKVEEKETTIMVPTEIDWDTFINMLEEILDSDRIRQFHSSRKNDLANLITNLKSGTLDDANFMMQFSQLYAQWLMMQNF
ncbi:MAG: leucine-rich repeat domain-containing protein, partial [Promethearchaeota archaeon]